MLMEMRLKNPPQEFGHVCVDEWFAKSTCPYSFYTCFRGRISILRKKQQSKALFGKIKHFLE